VRFDDIPFAMEEVLFDPQTSGGLLVAAAPGDADSLLKDLQGRGLPAAMVGEILAREDQEIQVLYH
jgi:selenide,water dikinase